ncbi:RNA-binding protein [Leptospira hartskeerlii]|uniref:RNA-binding protein n=1 Tax=Leptospira hartskeerlii TaxID=2023177 RepID=A0A2M9XF83_9LEPT|nr:RNA-binding protein [Leptospira hartskeerlii]PJZ26337.1 RNA-binding protein [Leptospira hartskeerlii]PJZ34422.1 RNA-binding protein [Leptospira hartskeerlii]
MKISVGNLPQEWTEEDLEKLFSKYGKAEHISIKKDKLTGRSLGYGSLEMEDGAAKKALEALNKYEVSGKVLTVVDADEWKKEFDKKQSVKGGPSHNKVHGSQTTGGFGSSVRRTGGRGK